MFQLSLADLGRPLAETTFVVVDLETTGGSPENDRITEIGAVKVRMGERLGELATLVDPGRAIPGSITALTGISDASVQGRPPVEVVLPSFLEFSAGCALVAHNARFDTGFLNAALRRLDYPVLDHPVVCTAMLARRLVGDEVRNRRLGTLATHFRSSTVPIHRALSDARATVDVFHALLEQAGTFGVVTLEDLIAFSHVRNTPLFSSRRKMADDLPSSPGVYSFISASDEVLYVGKATDLRARVRQYFGTDQRPRIAQLVTESARVDHRCTPTAVEAEVLESRLIRQHRPRFNRRGKSVRTPVWVTLTGGAYPRLSITRKAPAPSRASLGPLPSRRIAEQIVQAVTDVVPIRRCTTAMRADTRFDACALAEMGRCLAPCIGRVDPDGYADAVDRAAAVLSGDLSDVLPRLESRMRERAAAGRFEEAAEMRDRVDCLSDWVVRSRRNAALRRAGVVVAVRPTTGSARELLVLRGGWLVGTATAADGTVSAAAARLLGTLASGSAQDDGESGPPPPDELAIAQRWLARPGVTLEHADEGLAWPISGGQVTDALRTSITAAKRSTGKPDRHLAAKRLQRRSTVPGR